MKKRKLYRSKNKVVGGVCAGLADYFDIDPIIMRLLFVVFILSGFGLLVYILAWIFVPSK